MAYTSQASVTIPAATGSTQTNISLVITGTDTKLKTVANGGQIQNIVTRVGQTVPADLILSSDTAGTLLYNWGWDFYDPVNGIATIWLLMPSHSSSSSTTIYISIGNAAVTTYQGGTQGSEFDTNTKAVYHFANGTTLSAKDSGSGSLDGVVNSATAHAGQIDGGMATSGSQDVSVANTAALNVQTGTDFTIQTWFYMVTNPGTTAIFDKGALGRDYSIFCISATSIYVEIGGAGGSMATSGFTTGAWHHLVLTRNATVGKIYLDGADTGNAFANGVGNAGSNISIGRGVSGGSDFNGYHDEFKICNTGRTANWIATEYANQLTIPVMGAFASLGTAYTKSVSETYTLAETFVKRTSRALAEILTLSDALGKATRRTVADTFTLSDVYSRMVALKRTFTDAPSLTDAISNIGPHGKLNLNDTIQIIDFFIISLLRDPSLRYYRQYMLDLTSLPQSNQPSAVPISSGPSDASLGYYRRYLGRT